MTAGNLVRASHTWKLSSMSRLFGIRRGEPIAIYDGRPNGEVVLATGRLEDDNPSDCLTVKVGLVQADRLFTAKKQILESMGFSVVQVREHVPACTGMLRMKV